jgi:hypothetical protein
MKIVYLELMNVNLNEKLKILKYDNKLGIKFKIKLIY